VLRLGFGFGSEVVPLPGLLVPIPGKAEVAVLSVRMRNLRIFSPTSRIRKATHWERRHPVGVLEFSAVFGQNCTSSAGMRRSRWESAKSG